MQKRMFDRYSREIKEALASGGETRLLELAARSAGLIEKAGHGLGQFARFGELGGLGRYKKAIARAGMLATVQERELALFALFFFAGQQKDRQAAGELANAYREFFLGKTPVAREPGCVPPAAWATILSMVLEAGVDPEVVFPLAAHADAAGDLVVLQSQRAGEDAEGWPRILAAAAKTDKVQYSDFQKAAVRLGTQRRPEAALAAVESIVGQIFRNEALKALVATLTAAGLETQAFACFLKLGKQAEIYEDQLAMPILTSLVKKKRWLEAARILAELPRDHFRSEAMNAVIMALSQEEAPQEEIWGRLTAMLDFFPCFDNDGVRARLAQGMARHGLYDGALAQVEKLESEASRKEAMMRLMARMQEAGAQPERIRQMMQAFNAPDGAWNRPQTPPLPSITGMLADFLNQSGFTSRLRRVSEIFGDFCGRAPAYKRLLDLGLEDEAFAEALELSRAGRKSAALAEIALALHGKGRREEAEVVLQHGLKSARELADAGEKARCLSEIALGVAGSGDAGAAGEIFSEALTMVQAIETDDHKIWPLERIVICEARAGFSEKAQEHLGLLLPLFRTPGLEEPEERLSDLIGDLVEAGAVEAATAALRFFLQTMAAEPDRRHLFKLEYRLKRIETIPGWVILCLVSLSSELGSGPAGELLWRTIDLAVEKRQWDLAAAAALRLIAIDRDSFSLYSLRQELLRAEEGEKETARLLTAYPEALAMDWERGSGWLVVFSLLLKGGLEGQAAGLLKKKLAENPGRPPSPCQKELQEMEAVASASDGPRQAVVAWAVLPGDPAALPGEGEGSERFNRMFSAILEEKSAEEKGAKLASLFWRVPPGQAATLANILAYHPQELRLPAVVALTRRAVVEQDRSLARLAVPLACDCLNAVKMCRLAMGMIAPGRGERDQDGSAG